MLFARLERISQVSSRDITLGSHQRILSFDLSRALERSRRLTLLAAQVVVSRGGSINRLLSLRLGWSGLATSFEVYWHWLATIVRAGVVTLGVGCWRWPVKIKLTNRGNTHYNFIKIPLM